MASFFYADIKTDELQVHGHNPSIPAQIELLDANASNMVIIKAPVNLSQPSVSITLPSSVSNTNSLMMNTGGTGVLELITPSGDLSMANYGSFTLNSISNTSTITSTANISLASGKQLNLGSTANIGYDANTNIILSGSNQVIAKLGGQQVFSATYTGGNALINMGSTSGESGIGFKNTSDGQIQVKPNSSTSWTNLVTHLSNLGDVTITTPANTNALLYNSGTSKWTNRQITLNDISQVSVSGQTSNQALFYNGTNFTNRSPLYTDLTGNVAVLPFLESNVRICAGAGVGGQTQRCIAIGHSAGAGGQSAGAIAIGWLAGTAGQGFRSIAIGTAAQSIGSQPNYSMVLNASSSSVNALQDNSTYIAPIRNDNTSNVVMYNPSTYEMTYGSRDYFTLTMFGELNNTYVAATGTLKFLFSLNNTYWDVAPNASASPPSLTRYSSGAITYNTSNGIIELNSAKNYYMDLDVQMSVNYDTTATMVMELVKNPVTSNTILCTSKLEASASVDYVFYTLPMKTIIQTASNIRINVYKSTAAGTATLLSPDCQITMFLQEI